MSRFDTAMFVFAAVCQLAAMAFAVKMILDVKDRRPWVCLLAALAVMFVLRCFALVLSTQTRLLISPISAPLVSLLLFISLFYIRKVAIAERESENRYRALVELSPDTIFVNSKDQIVYINPAGLKFFAAKDASQLVGHSPLEFVGPESVDLVRTRAKLLIGGTPTLPPAEEQWLRLDGSNTYV